MVQSHLDVRVSERIENGAKADDRESATPEPLRITLEDVPKTERLRNGHRAADGECFTARRLDAAFVLTLLDWIWRRLRSAKVNPGRSTLAA